MDAMSKYTNMVLNNKILCEQKRILAIETIQMMKESGQRICISELTKATGLSRSFFYKNPEVNEFLTQAQYEQQGKVLTSRRDKTLNAALKEMVRLQKSEIDTLRRDNAGLRTRVSHLQNELQNNEDFERIKKM